MLELFRKFDKALDSDNIAIEEIYTSLVTKQLTSEEIQHLLTYWQDLSTVKELHTGITIEKNSDYWYLGGLLYQLGMAIEKTAIKYYKKAIALNNRPAKYGLAFIYYVAGDTKNDKTKIEKSSKILDDLISSIDRDDKSFIDAKALCLKASILIYDNSYKYAADAIRLLNRAIKLNGLVAAKHVRAHMHIFGMGGDVNCPAAIRLLDECIATGFPDSFRLRGYMHSKGLGGNVDKKAAIDLFYKAVEKGDKKAILSCLNLLADPTTPKLTNSQIAFVLIKYYLHKEELPGTIEESKLNQILQALPLQYHYKIALGKPIQSTINKNKSSISFGKLISKNSMLFKKPIPNPLDSLAEDLLYKQPIHILTNLLKDTEKPLSAIETCSKILFRFPEFANQATDVSILNLISETYMFLAAEKSEQSKHDEACELYKRVPKETSFRAEACSLIAQRIYFKATLEENMDSEKALNLARPFLDEAIALKDRNAVLFFQEIKKEMYDLSPDVEPLNEEEVISAIAVYM